MIRRVLLAGALLASLAGCATTTRSRAADEAGDVAYQRGTFTVAATPKAGGNTNRIRGNFLRIYRRQPDGTWNMTVDMFNSDQPVRSVQ